MKIKTSKLNESNKKYNPDASSSWTHRTSGQTAVVLGCIDSNAINYDPNANTDDGTCIDRVFGCIDVNAYNYDNLANTDDGTCAYETKFWLLKNTGSGGTKAIWPIANDKNDHTITINELVANTDMRNEDLSNDNKYKRIAQLMINTDIYAAQFLIESNEVKAKGSDYGINPIGERQGDDLLIRSGSGYSGQPNGNIENITDYDNLYFFIETINGIVPDPNKIDNNTFLGSTIHISGGSNVEITENITINSASEYLDLKGDNITIDGKGYTITVTVPNYPGFIKNGSSGIDDYTPCSNCTIKNINVATSGIGSLAQGGGWIGHGYFGKGINGGNILFGNCSSSGDVSQEAGGIIGRDTGQSMDSSTITFDNCYSTGVIANNAGGISGYQTGNSMTNSNVIANNCYTIGSLGTNAGGIYGSNSSATHSECIYFNGKSVDIMVPVTQTAGTWIYSNAFVTIGTSTTNNDVTDVWHSPDVSSQWTHRTSGQTGIIQYTPNDGSELETAVDLWGTDRNAALASYQHISTWNTKNVDDMKLLFENATDFNDDISRWNVSNVDNFKFMFQDASAFNQDISGWDVSATGEGLYGMFSGASSFNQDVSNWKTSSFMGAMFIGATAFNNGGQPLTWDMSDVKDLEQMFNGASSFNQDISSWDVSSVTDMHSMFYGASSFNQDISSWNVGNVSNMSKMFFIASSFNQDIRGWNVNKVQDFDDMFEYATIMNNRYSAPDTPTIAWFDPTAEIVEPEPEPEPGPEQEPSPLLKINFDELGNTNVASQYDNYGVLFDNSWVTYTTTNNDENFPYDSGPNVAYISNANEALITFDPPISIIAMKLNLQSNNINLKLLGINNDILQEIVPENNVTNYDVISDFYNNKIYKIEFSGNAVSTSTFTIDTIKFNRSEVEPLKGWALDGYISGSTGGLYDINDLDNPIETFITDSSGKYYLITPSEQLPEVYTIKFEPGGTDISTGNTVTTELTSTSTKDKALTSDEAILNVTPITSLVTKIVKKTEGPINVNNLNDSVEVVTTVFNISESDLEKDFIKEGDANVTGLVTQLETTTKSLAAAINNDSASESVILDSLVNFMIESKNDTNSNVIDLSDETNITGIVEQVETDNKEIVISETLKANATSLISQVNAKVQEITEDSNKTFEDVITESVQLSISTENTLTTIDLDNVNISLNNIISNIETNAVDVSIKVIFQEESEIVADSTMFCNDPDACNYKKFDDCKYLDCSGICGGNAYKDSKGNCIIDYKYYK